MSVERKAMNKKKGAKAKAKRQYSAQAAWGPGSTVGGFSGVKVTNVSGQADVEEDMLRYETTSAFTATGGAASYLQLKGNSIYRPYPGNTDSVGGYARMYTQYKQSYVTRSEVEVRIWSATGTSSQEPFRLIIVPCTSDQYTVYSGFSNIAQLSDVPHAAETLFSPGGALPRLRSRASTANIQLGDARERGLEAIQTNNYWGTSGADPSSGVWYYLVGLQNMAGTTTLNCQIQVRMTYYIKWRQPIATAVQVAVTRFGTEFPPESKRKVAESVEKLDREIDALAKKAAQLDAFLERFAPVAAGVETKSAKESAGADDLVVVDAEDLDTLGLARQIQEHVKRAAARAAPVSKVA